MAGFGIPADHATLQAAIDAHDTDNVAVTLELANQSHSGGGIINNATTPAIFTIKAAAGAECRGISRTSGASCAHLTHNPSSGAVLWLVDTGSQNVTVENISIEHTGTGGDCFQTNASGGITIAMRVCPMHGAPASAFEVVTACVTNLENCPGYDCGAQIFVLNVSGTTGTLSYCTAADGTFGFVLASGHTVENCIAGNNSTWDFFGSGPGVGFTKTTCVSEDTSGTTGLTGAEWLEAGDTPTKDYVAFTDKDTVGGQDFHIEDLGHGTWSNLALAAATVVSVTVDCDNEARDGTSPDCGIDELVAVGGATPKGVFGLAIHGPLTRAVY